MTDSKERIKFSNQTFYLYCYIVGWGKTGPAHSPPPPPLQNVLIFLFIFQSFSLCYSFTVSEDLWMTHSKEIIKFSNQKVYWLSPSKVFQPLYFILVNWFFQIDTGLGKDWADFPLTHSNNHFELRTYSFCTIYNQILLHPLHFCAVLRVVEL